MSLEASRTEPESRIPDRANAASRAPKNLILCSDGTGNRGGRGNGTNVWRLHRSVNLNSKRMEQRTYYHDGVGTDDNRFVKAIGGAFGFGLSSNVRSLYKFLVKNYSPGDSIYLFGFSRGAFTVRSLAGFVASCGILDLDREGERGDAPIEEHIDAAVMAAFDAYRFAHLKSKEGSWISAPLFRLFRFIGSGRWRRPMPVDEIKKRFSYQLVLDAADSDTQEKLPQQPVIRCVGVWDTVSAIGAPMDWMRNLIDWLFCIRFHNHDLGEHIEHGFHALSIDEERQSFSPTLWDEQKSKSVLDNKRRRAGLCKGQEAPVFDSVDRGGQSIQQVWFAGVHSNVGGGYPKQGLAAVSLYWMMERASGLGLEFESVAVEEVRRDADVNDKLYDSRSGVGVYYRYQPRAIAELCRDKLAVKAGPKGNNGYESNLPWIHASVLERIKRAPEGYAPGNFPTAFEVDFRSYATPGITAEWGQELKRKVAERANQAEGKQPDKREAGDSAEIEASPSAPCRNDLLEAVSLDIRIRRTLHATFVLVTLLGLIGSYLVLANPVWPKGLSATEQIGEGIKAVFTAIAWMIGCIKSPIDSIGTPLLARLEANPLPTAGVIAVVMLAGFSHYRYSKRVRERMRKRFRIFWRGIAAETPE